MNLDIQNYLCYTDYVRDEPITRSPVTGCSIGRGNYKNRAVGLLPQPITGLATLRRIVLGEQAPPAVKIVEYKENMESIITGFEDYSITQEGEVFSYKWGKKRKLKTRLNRGGYAYVNLTPRGGRYKSRLVHRLVAQAYLANYTESLQVNHIDGNKVNNNVANLEMVTAAENSNHAWRLGLCENARHLGEKHGKHKLTEREVKSIRQDNRSSYEIAKDYGVDRSNISRIKLRETWTHI